MTECAVDLNSVCHKQDIFSLDKCTNRIEILNIQLADFFYLLCKYFCLLFSGSVFLLENLRFHPEEEGKGKDAEGKKVTHKVTTF